MMFMQRSSGVSESVSRMCRADAQTFRWLSGTILGREVVPEVCSTSAVSSASAAPGAPAAPRNSDSSANPPAGPSLSGVSSISGTPAAAAASRAGESSPRCTSTARASRSER